MQVRLTKPWTPLTPEAVARQPGQLGVYEIADASDELQHRFGCSDVFHESSKFFTNLCL